METGYNYFLVFLSYCISVLGSYTALKLAAGMSLSRDTNTFWVWLGAAAFALGGGGIWAMHFVGMLAYETPVDFGYNLVTTMLSLLLAVGVVAIGLFLVARRPDGIGRLLAGGTVTGLGVTAMHYSGMAAMVMPGVLVYDPALVAASMMIAIGASICALWLAFNVQVAWQRVVSALVMGFAVCGMHYTGMAALHLQLDHDVVGSLALMDYAAVVDPAVLAVIIAVVVVGLMLSLLVGTMAGYEEQRRLEAVRVRN